MLLPRRGVPRVVAAMLAAHPYEEPAYDVVEMADPGTSATGAGRIGDVAETTLAAFAQHRRRGAARDRARRPGRRRPGAAGTPGRGVRRRRRLPARPGARQRRRRLRDQRPAAPPGGEFLEQGGPALVDVAHWAAEWTWLPVVRARVDEALGDTVETRVSTLRTDPWQFRL